MTALESAKPDWLHLHLTWCLQKLHCQAAKEKRVWMTASSRSARYWGGSWVKWLSNSSFRACHILSHPQSFCRQTYGHSDREVFILSQYRAFFFFCPSFILSFWNIFSRPWHSPSSHRKVLDALFGYLEDIGVAETLWPPLVRAVHAISNAPIHEAISFFFLLSSTTILFTNLLSFPLPAE